MAFEEDLQFDPEACGVAFQSFNEWLFDDWGFAYRDRLFTSPYLAMGDRDAAVQSVEWALGHGARLFVVRPTGVYTTEGKWRSPGDPWFDPIWVRLHEAGVTVVPHVAEVGGFGLERFITHGQGIIGSAPPPLQVAVGHERPIANYLAALVCDKVFERFPNLRIASVENGAEFLPLVMAGLRRAGFQRPGYFGEDPIATFKRHVWVAPFWEDSLSEAVEQIGAERVLFGSDWPHPEGMAEPRDYEKTVAELQDDYAAQRIMHANAAELTRSK
jgi:predicted TIM-barrel fold metal-dependent hydrolase